MTMRLWLSILVISALSLSAADVSGKWSGTIEIKTEGGSKTEPAMVILKQEGTGVTGSGGPHEGEQHAIQNGKVEGNTITFDIPRSGERVMHFDLTATGDQIEGQVTAPKKEGGGTDIARLSLKRVKVP